MTKRTIEALGIKEQRAQTLMLKSFEMMFKAQMNPENFFEILKEYEDMNETEKLWVAINSGRALQHSSYEKVISINEKYEKLEPIILKLEKTTKKMSDIGLRVSKMKELTLLEKIIVCFNTGRIIEALYGPNVSQPPGMKSGFTK